MAAYDVNPNATAQNVTEFIPLEYKLLIYANPLVLSEGTALIMGTDIYSTLYQPQLFDLGGGITLGLLMVAAWFAIGLLAFSRERRDKDWLTLIKGKLRRA